MTKFEVAPVDIKALYAMQVEAITPAMRRAQYLNKLADLHDTSLQTASSLNMWRWDELKRYSKKDDPFVRNTPYDSGVIVLDSGSTPTGKFATVGRLHLEPTPEGEFNNGHRIRRITPVTYHRGVAVPFEGDFEGALVPENAGQHVARLISGQLVYVDWRTTDTTNQAAITNLYQASELPQEAVPEMAVVDVIEAARTHLHTLVSPNNNYESRAMFRAGMLALQSI